MIGSVEIKTNKVRFSEISAEEKPFAFRLPSAAADSALKSEIAMLGLIYPITVEAVEPGRFVIIDGYRRFHAIQSLKKEGANWEEIPAVIFDSGQLLTHEKLILLREKNMAGENAYKPFEKARLLDEFQKRGLSREEMAEHCGLTQSEIQTYLFLTEAPESFVNLIIDNEIPDAFSLSLINRYRQWQMSPYKNEADNIAEKIVRHLKEGPLSILSWKFLLDFYWAERPFMTPRVPRP